MVLSIRTYKVRKKDCQPVYKTYRYAGFDSDYEMSGKTFEEKFNHAFSVLREEIDQDRENNEVNLYDAIKIADVWLS